MTLHGLDPKREVWPFEVGLRAGLADLADLENGKPIEDDETFIETSLELLDDAFRGGLRPKQMTVLGAPTGHGKSALVEQIALHASRKHHTTFFALELGYRRTRNRMLAKLMRTDEQSVKNMLRTNAKIAKPHFEALAYERSLRVEQRFDGEPFTFDLMARMVIANKPRLVIIDHMRYLDDWNPEGHNFGRSDLATGRVVRRLLDMAKVCDLHVIAVQQLKATTGRRPTIDDLADTRMLAQEADAVVLLHRPNHARGATDDVAELIIDKNRNGSAGIVHTHWNGRLMRYDDMTAEDEANLACCKPTKRGGAR